MIFQNTVLYGLEIGSPLHAAAGGGVVEGVHCFGDVAADDAGMHESAMTKGVAVVVAVMLQTTGHGCHWRAGRQLGICGHGDDRAGGTQPRSLRMQCTISAAISMDTSTSRSNSKAKYSISVVASTETSVS